MTDAVQDILTNSVVVVAHPDDEVLWFSSILSDADRLVVCFTDVPDNPGWSAGRDVSLTDHPHRNLERLDLSEAGVFWSVDWSTTEETEYGLEIATSDSCSARYRHNYELLLAKLSSLLSKSDNVFTHNPWGEYGNAEHVQVYRAIRTIQRQHGFDVWVPSYCSNKTAALMVRTMPVLSGDIRHFSTDTSLAERLANLYRKNGCWTWYDDYEWPDSESFFAIRNSGENVARPGSTRPLHLIQIDDPPKVAAKPGLRRRIGRAARRILGLAGRDRRN